MTDSINIPKNINLDNNVDLTALYNMWAPSQTLKNEIKGENKQKKNVAPNFVINVPPSITKKNAQPSVTSNPPPTVTSNPPPTVTSNPPPTVTSNPPPTVTSNVQPSVTSNNSIQINKEKELEEKVKNTNVTLLITQRKLMDAEKKIKDLLEAKNKLGTSSIVVPSDCESTSKRNSIRKHRVERKRKI